MTHYKSQYIYLGFISSGLLILGGLLLMTSSARADIPTLLASTTLACPAYDGHIMSAYTEQDKKDAIFAMGLGIVCAGVAAMIGIAKAKSQPIDQTPLRSSLLASAIFAWLYGTFLGVPTLNKILSLTHFTFWSALGITIIAVAGCASPALQMFWDWCGRWLKNLSDTKKQG